ncbi:mechanosensitive ion channel family protein [Allocoleopsis franciscana]|uniref:Small-conductance mechanosensitive channel n=1 Tax=Allocoleopsis franciscana PCC 7113 TaxID=1173027 RepID=K9WJ34_9CYAN|nr:mechanosensitive ion channel domain-containing protein [Allocoleopsis franciscana]AFZ20193.1 small-conductance mechanosensitive channel [Allocoleopsis franciscana PCC 7113]
MLNKLLPFEADTWAFVLSSLLLAVGGAVLLYIVMFYILRSIFRKFERDIALVTLNVSAYPALTVFILAVLKLTFHQLPSVVLIDGFENILAAGLIIAASYWLVQLFIQVFIYYLKDFTQQTEAMWDDVLLPLLEAVVPVVIVLIASVFVLRSLGVDLTGIWVALGGATFVIGFAAQGILANFFSGVVLLIDTPFQFGDVLRLEDGSIAMLRKIGVRVTQLYLPSQHCDIYIPNSKLQEQNIVNLSRPTAYYHYSTEVSIPFVHDAREVKQVIRETILAHPDTLGDIERKLELIDRYSQIEELEEQRKFGRLRLLAEQDVNYKLEEIAPALEALVVTLQFAEKGGLTQDEIENVQQEYRDVLAVIGLEITTEIQNNRSVVTLQETRSKDNLIGLVREWYRACMRDPNLLDNDSYMIPDEWERKITLLKRRTQRLYQKISNPQREETRLDDYVMELKQWLQERFKQPRQKWQEPQVLVKEIEHDEANCYIKFQLNFFVDDIKLENGKRGDRVSSQIYQSVVQYLQHSQETKDLGEEVQLLH